MATKITMKPLLMPVLIPLCVCALLLAMLMSLLQGPAPLSLNQIFSILAPEPLTMLSPGSNSAPAWAHTVIWQVRLPRIICAALVGAALAISGALLQGLFRNPLASPSVLGVSSGASLGAVTAIFLGLATVASWSLPVLAFIGAGLTLVVVYRVGSINGQAHPATLLLAGVAISAFNIALTALLLALALQNWELGRAMIYWSMGGLDGRGWQHVWLLLPLLLAALLMLRFDQRELDILLLGESHASSVGVDVGRLRLRLLLVSALLTAAAVSVAGGIGFIGLVVPHICRIVIGPQHQRLMPLSALLGALLLVLADWLVRTDTGQAQIPLGVITATLGAPFFLFLLLRQRQQLGVS